MAGGRVRQPGQSGLEPQSRRAEWRAGRAGHWRRGCAGEGEGPMAHGLTHAWPCMQLQCSVLPHAEAGTRTAPLRNSAHDARNKSSTLHAIAPSLRSRCQAPHTAAPQCRSVPTARRQRSRTVHGPRHVHCLTDSYCSTNRVHHKLYSSKVRLRNLNPDR